MRSKLQHELTIVEEKIVHVYHIVKTIIEKVHDHQEVIIKHVNIIRQDTGKPIEVPHPVIPHTAEGSVEPMPPVELEEINKDNKRVVESITTVLKDVTDADVHKYTEAELHEILIIIHEVEEITKKIIVLEK